MNGFVIRMSMFIAAAASQCAMTQSAVAQVRYAPTGRQQPAGGIDIPPAAIRGANSIADTKFVLIDLGKVAVDWMFIMVSNEGVLFRSEDYKDMFWSDGVISQPCGELCTSVWLTTGGKILADGYNGEMYVLSRDSNASWIAQEISPDVPVLRMNDLGSVITIGGTPSAVNAVPRTFPYGCINNHDDWAYTQNGGRAQLSPEFVESDGRMHDLPFRGLGGLVGWVNDYRQVCGVMVEADMLELPDGGPRAVHHLAPVLWDNGNVKELEASGNAICGFVNNFGQGVGASDIPIGEVTHVSPDGCEFRGGLFWDSGIGWSWWSDWWEEDSHRQWTATLWENGHRIDLNTRLLSASGWKLNIAAGINDKGEIVGYGTKDGEDRYFLLVPFRGGLAVDANRDAAIEMPPTDSGAVYADATSLARPYCFWLNDDDDGDSDGAEDVKNSSTIDYDRTSIKNTRDLEDFARVWIDASGIATALKNGDLQLALRWSDVTGTPKIKLFKAYESDGGTQYLRDATTAGSQIAGEFGQPIASVAGAVVVSPNQTFVLKKEVFASLTDAQSKAFFLFEGAGIGKGQLKLVLIDRNGGETEGGGVWFYLTNIKAMYERAVAGIGFNEPWNYAHPSDLPAFTASVTVDPQGWAFQQPADETKESLVFVHGWKMDAEDARIFSETMFKRLWWEGYKGRFRVFRWPTYTGDYSFSDSEFVAWKCGAALKSYVEGSVQGASLPSDYTRCVAAHSLGNVVVGSALKQGLTPTRYLLLQAAIPSGCYDTSDAVNGFANPSSASSAFNAVPSMAVFGSMFSGGEGSQPTPDNAAPDWGYRGFLTGITGGQFVNFCNPVDFALTTGNTVGIDTNWLAWQFGYKPRNRVIDSPEINYAYRYLSSAPSGQRLKLYRYYDSSHDTITAERFAADAPESMAFLARTRSLPIGADLQAGGSITSTVNLNADYGFGRSRADHSGEFRRPIQTVSEVYGRIREALR